MKIAIYLKLVSNSIMKNKLQAFLCLVIAVSIAVSGISTLLHLAGHKLITVILLISVSPLFVESCRYWRLATKERHPLEIKKTARNGGFLIKSKLFRLMRSLISLVGHALGIAGLIQSPY